MGWNDVRISLVPAGWKLKAELDRTARTAMNQQVSILHSEGDSERSTNRVDCRMIEAILGREGFTVSQAGPSFLRLERGQVEAFLVGKEGILSEIILTFTLNRQSPIHFKEWQILVDRLSHVGNLSLVDRATRERVGPEKLPLLVENSPAWKESAQRWDWPSLMDSTGCEVGNTGTPNDGEPEGDNELVAEMLPIVEETWRLSEAA